MARHCSDGSDIAGRGPTAGMAAAKYEATAPDGQTIVKRVFKCDAPIAFMGLYKDCDGGWRATGVGTDRARLAAYSEAIVDARRVS